MACESQLHENLPGRNVRMGASVGRPFMHTNTCGPKNERMAARAARKSFKLTNQLPKISQWVIPPLTSQFEKGIVLFLFVAFTTTVMIHEMTENENARPTHKKEASFNV